MARLQQLNAVKGGINRQRVKGGPSPSNLYDALNCFIDASGAVQSRPGTVGEVTLPAGTKGMTAFDGVLVVFSHQPKVIADPLVTCEVLSHPEEPELEIEEIHFAGPFLGSLYVAAEFTNGDVFHYWLESADEWQANTAYYPGQLVMPSVPNGLVYRATRGSPRGELWSADIPRELGDVIEPVVDNGFQYTVTDTIGAAPKSGKTEPNWPEKDGATVFEDTGIDAPPAPTTTPPPQQPPPGVRDRYGNNTFNNENVVTRLK